ncbi:MAG: hypothetical protein KAI62_07880, partial [Actinomycetia bacterium]|nr:hypothetical protein [Actinomycetes bacterium]
MRSISTNKKLLAILAVSLIAIVFFTSAVSCKLNDPGGEVTEETVEDPVTGTVGSDGIDEDSEPAVIDEEEEDIAVKIWIEDLIPEEISSEISDFLEGDQGIEIVEFKEQAQAVLEILPAGAIPAVQGTYEDLEIYYIMAPVVSFYNISDGT